MSPIPIHLATEDELSESVLFRLLSDAKRFAIGKRYRRGGNGYLKSTIAGWNRAAAGIPFLVLTDLDTHRCPSALIASWLTTAQHPNLVFRIAVREVESWLLADRMNFAKYLGIAETLIPAKPDELLDPKQTLIELARKSRNKAHREDIVPRKGSTAKQGPDYNARLGKFVNTTWNPVTAAKSSPSLARAVAKLAAFTPSWPAA
jgi:hypothetical protein